MLLRHQPEALKTGCIATAALSGMRRTEGLK